MPVSPAAPATVWAELGIGTRHVDDHRGLERLRQTVGSQDLGQQQERVEREQAADQAGQVRPSRRHSPLQRRLQQRRTQPAHDDEDKHVGSDTHHQREQQDEQHTGQQALVGESWRPAGHRHEVAETLRKLAASAPKGSTNGGRGLSVAGPIGCVEVAPRGSRTVSGPCASSGAADTPARPNLST